MLAAKNGHKDVISILTQRRANLDLANAVSINMHTFHFKPCVTEDKVYLLFIWKDSHQLLHFYNKDWLTFLKNILNNIKSEWKQDKKLFYIDQPMNVLKRHIQEVRYDQICDICHIWTIVTFWNRLKFYSDIESLHYVTCLNYFNLSPWYHIVWNIIDSHMI